MWIHGAGDCHGANAPRNDGGCGYLVPFRRKCGGCPTLYRGTVMTVPYNKKAPVSGETGVFALKLFVPIRRA